jgi:exopolyphosphatase/guanosine-5'-triphosphate,3'-diphosphate pyrophosphatase
MRKLPDTVAAVDLGSNSFHLIVGRMIDSRIHVLDRLKEMVRLGGGLNAEGNLTEVACQRALDCLHRFGERIAKMPLDSVRVVGTNTLRRARNAKTFLLEARAALGHPIEIISGIEEARLIYLGVMHNVADGGGRRLVVDIGGGSTELIIGERFEPRYMDSLYMGCVGMTQAWFAGSELNEDTWRRAIIAAQLELGPIAHFYRRVGWNASIGASGTILAVAKVGREMGLSQDGITLNAVHGIRKAMFKAGKIEKLTLPGLSKDRAPVFPGGVVILEAIMEGLKIDYMTVSEGALREGLIYDLLGRIHHEDVRVRTVEALVKRFQIDTEHTKRVETTALFLFKRVSEAWRLSYKYVDTLVWAAQLHEIGLAIAHTQYHKHGAYLIENADLHGFSRQEQQVLAALVRSHRRKFPWATFNQIPDDQRYAIMRLSILLRLSVLLHRTRASRDDVAIQAVYARNSSLEVVFPEGMLDRYPLIKADLENERNYLKAGDFELTFR